MDCCDGVSAFHVWGAIWLGATSEFIAAWLDVSAGPVVCPTKPPRVMGVGWVPLVAPPPGMYCPAAALTRSWMPCGVAPRTFWYWAQSAGPRRLAIICR